MADLDAYKHNFVPDDEGLFCLFCGVFLFALNAPPHGPNPTAARRANGSLHARRIALTLQ